MYFFLKLSLIILFSLMGQNCFADYSLFTHTKKNFKSQANYIDGISTQLLMRQSQTITFPETYFSFGIFHESLREQTKENYHAAGLGVSLGFDQHIRDNWSGGVEVRWSDWKAKDNSNIPDTSPLALYSKVSFSPQLNPNILSQTLIHFFHIYFTGGLGYSFFFDNRSFLAAKSKTESGQMSATYGLGTKLIFPASIAFKFGFEQWRGIQNSNYFSQGFFAQLSVGDVDKF